MQVKNGNAYARERLISCHLRLALKIALSFSKKHKYDLEDCVSAGFIGLITAADRFDPNGFSTFQGYASMWILQTIERECKPKWIEYYLPINYRDKTMQISEDYDDLVQEAYLSLEELVSLIAKKRHLPYEQSEIRTELEQSINDIFKRIYNGGLSITIDERYNISVYVNDYEGGVETSTAQSISVIFAFITAIIKMARDNQRKNEDMSYSEPYPLVMDAPLSAFDKRRIKAVCDAIPDTAEQVIIFIKDTDGDLAEEHLGNKVLKRHYLEKIDELHTRLI